jgi:hypothetical protein
MSDLLRMAQWIPAGTEVFECGHRLILFVLRLNKRQAVLLCEHCSKTYATREPIKVKRGRRVLEGFFIQNALKESA